MKLFVIDDDTERAQSTAHIATKTGFAETDVHFASSEADAMRLIQARIPAIAVVDANLTDRYEQEGLRVITAIHQTHRKCLIICISAAASGITELGTQAFQSGADNFIGENWMGVYSKALLEKYLRIYRVLAKRRSAQEGVLQEGAAHE